MTLRVRLVVSFTVLLLAVTAAVGLAASGSIQRILTDQVDRTLLGFVGRGPGPGAPGDRPFPQDADRPLLSPFAELAVDPDGSIVFARPSGFNDDPDALPDISKLTPGRLETVSAEDGSLTYRAIAVEMPDGYLVVRAAPLRDIQRATDQLVLTVVIVGASVLVLGGLATWWTVRRAMRPVDEMVHTVEAIADGDLSQRVPQPDSRTELGRLGHSVNAMLGDIEAGIERDRASRDRLRQFVGDASHELRTPLAAITGYAELHRSGALEDDDAEQQAWARIESESARMNRLVSDLLVLTRLGQTQPLDLGPVDLYDICHDAVADHAAIDPTRPATLDGDHVVVSGDRQRLHQVVSNLLANARVHTPEGTAVHLSVHRKGDVVEVIVADTGPGIPEGVRDQVFERFYRADPSRSRRSGGSGLGLAIVDAIIRAHDGQVVAEGDASGGARMVVRLPLKVQ